MDDIDMSLSAPAIRGPLGERDQALLELLQRLGACGYSFTTPTQSTHRIVARRLRVGQSAGLRDVFGWNLAFHAQDVDPEMLNLMRRGRILRRRGLRLKSKLRVASLGGRLFLHSAFPPSASDAVFFGPDSYRFAEFVRAKFPRLAEGARILDIGAGSGVGGITAVGLAPTAKLILTDVNPKALGLAKINAASAGVSAQFVQTSGLDGIDAGLDLILANPPFIAGSGGRTYRDGGEMHGGEISLAWAKAAAERLAPGGRLLMYTGSAIVAGADRLKEALGDALRAARCSFEYREIDPDIFGGTLRLPSYREVERIAAVGLVAVKEG